MARVTLCGILGTGRASGGMPGTGILPRVAPSWEAQRYLFVTNLPLPDYYSGSPAPITGMTVPFSVVVLTIWAIAATAVAYGVFLRRDVLA